MTNAMFNGEEIDYLNGLLISALEWDDEVSETLIESILDKLEENTIINMRLKEENV